MQTAHICKGFLTYDKHGHEVHYARTETGKVFRFATCLERTPHFGDPRRPHLWHACDAVPDCAEFIGNYYVPSL